jgi:putative sterol carrier protein
MNLNEVAEALKTRVTGKTPLGGTLKFDLSEAGAIFIDGSGADNLVSTNNAPADCTVSMSAEDFAELIAGRLAPTSAFMQGKMKVDGDMGVAMKLSQLV